MGGFNYIQAIGAELQKADQLAAEIPEQIGMFTVKTANRTIKEAALRPNPNALWLTLWYEGEVCCLFSDSNLGKSIYAVQIATSIAEKQRVLYFDFELSDQRFSSLLLIKTPRTLCRNRIAVVFYDGVIHSGFWAWEEHLVLPRCAFGHPIDVSVPVR